MAGLVLVTPPQEEPLSLGEAKDHLRVTSTGEDSLIGRLIVTARQSVERRLGRALPTQTYDYFLDAFPRGDAIEVPRPPLQSVTSVKYTPDGGVETTFASADYLVDTTGHPGRIVLGVSEAWPSDQLQAINGLVVRFVAGYGNTPTDIPEPIRQAVLIYLATLFEHREAVVAGTTVSPLPTVDRLLDPYIWRRVV